MRFTLFLFMQIIGHARLIGPRSGIPHMANIPVQEGTAGDLVTPWTRFNRRHKDAHRLRTGRHGSTPAAVHTAAADPCEVLCYGL